MVNRSLLVIPTLSDKIKETAESSKAQESSRKGCVCWHNFQQLMPRSLLAAGICGRLTMVDINDFVKRLTLICMWEECFLPGNIYICIYMAEKGELFSEDCLVNHVALNRTVRSCHLVDRRSHLTRSSHSSVKENNKKRRPPAKSGQFLDHQPRRHKLVRSIDPLDRLCHTHFDSSSFSLRKWER